eukprot:7278067-Lingulodinium_polyedra.AAC.1
MPRRERRSWVLSSSRDFRFSRSSRLVCATRVAASSILPLPQSARRSPNSCAWGSFGPRELRISFAW